MANALGTPGGVVTDEHHRLAMAGMIAAQSSTLAVRTGVLWGPGSASVITGTSATGTMTVNVAAHHWVTSRAAGDGVYLGTKETSTTVTIAAAPGSNSRIDVVYSKQNDAGSTISPDGSTGELYGVVTGTAAASPTKPALPAGAVEVGTVTVAAGATNTLGAGVTISNSGAITVARGAPVPVRSQAERDALATAWGSSADGLSVKRLDLGGVEQQRISGAWKTVYTDTPPTAPTNNGGTTGVLAGTAPPAGTLLLTKTVYTTMTTNASGDATVNYPSAFANGLVGLSLTHISLGGVPSNNIEFVPWNPSLSSVNIRAYFGTATLASTPGIAISLVLTGW